MVKDAVPLGECRRALVLKLRHHGDVLLAAPVLSVLKAHAPALEVDLFVEAPFDFEDAWSRRVVVPLETTRASVVALRDLLDMKRRAGRPIDLDDVDALGEERVSAEFDRGWDGPRRRQARLGLGLTPVERLRWLSETVAEMRRIQGRARASEARRSEEDEEGPRTP